MKDIRKLLVESNNRDKNKAKSRVVRGNKFASEGFYERSSW